MTKYNYTGEIEIKKIILENINGISIFLTVCALTKKIMRFRKE
jgi:hypothetical protein